jgi:hypothetical protein
VFKVYGNVIQCAAKSIATDEHVETASMHRFGAQLNRFYAVFNVPSFG